MDSSDTQLEQALRRAQPAIGDDDFSESVMRALPRRRFAGAKARRWTLGGAAVAGGVLATLLGGPLASAFSSIDSGSGFAASVFAVLLIAVVAVPAAWVFYSE